MKATSKLAIIVERSRMSEPAHLIPPDATPSDVAWAIRLLGERGGLDAVARNLTAREAKTVEVIPSASVEEFRTRIGRFADDAADELVAAEAAAS